MSSPTVDDREDFESYVDVVSAQKPPDPETLEELVFQRLKQSLVDGGQQSRGALKDLQAELDQFAEDHEDVKGEEVRKLCQATQKAYNAVADMERRMATFLDVAQNRTEELIRTIAQRACADLDATDAQNVAMQSRWANQTEEEHVRQRILCSEIERGDEQLSSALGASRTHFSFFQVYHSKMEGHMREFKNRMATAESRLAKYELTKRRAAESVGITAAAPPTTRQRVA